MKIVINTPGAYITKVGECFQVKIDSEKSLIPAKKVEQILITTAAAMSSDMLELAVEHNIDVVFLKNTGRPFARVWHSKLGSISTIRRKQLVLQDNTLGVEFVKEWIVQKIEDQIKHLNKLAINRRDDRKTFLKEEVNKLKEQIEKINKIKAEKISDIRGTLQGYEGSASKTYFNALNEVINKDYKFNGRSRNPAKDKFNCLLNYGYGILYSNVEKACIIAGLDPYIGILHVDNYNRKALTFDLIEMYRVYIDEVVFKMISTKKVKDEFFDVIEDGYYLNKDGKVAFIDEVNKVMQSKIKYKGKNIEIQNIIQYDCHRIANRILKEVKEC